MSVNFNISEITNRIIFGIPLYDSQGNPFPDELLQSYLDSAVAWIEQTLNIVIQPRTEEEYHDYMSSDYMNWNFLKLWKKPILSVESLEMWYGDRQMLTIPSEWIKIDHLSGHLQIFPISGISGGIILNAAGGIYQPLVHGQIGYAPQMWKVNYTAGMNEQDEDQIVRVTTLHPMLKEIILKKAAASIMGVWGDLIIGAGIANQSIGIDGLSQSIGTTQSPMYGGASARIEQLNKDIEDVLPALRSYYDGISMVVV